LNLQPDLVEAYLVFAQMHLNQGNYQQVLKDCEKVLSITPDNSPGLIFSALAYMNMGNNSMAEQVLKKIPPNSFFQNHANCCLAYLNKKKNNLTEVNNLVKLAKKRLEDGFFQGDESNMNAKNMFLIQIVEGNKTEAYKWLKKAVDFGFRDFASCRSSRC
jgi:tetratricopeptide (TPR) repeat protein